MKKIPRIPIAILLGILIVVMVFKKSTYTPGKYQNVARNISCSGSGNDIRYLTRRFWQPAISTSRAQGECDKDPNCNAITSLPSGEFILHRSFGVQGRKTGHWCASKN